MRTYILICITILLFGSCKINKAPFYKKENLNWTDQSLPTQSDLVHTLYLVGDVGAFDDVDKRSNIVLDHLSNVLPQESENASIVYLGDNLKSKGLRKKNDDKREEGEALLDVIISASENFKGNTYLIPGDNDWNDGRAGGLKAIKRQEKYLDKHSSKNDHIKWYPKDGCGDPKAVKVNKDVVFIFIDSQWWLQEWDYERSINKGCEVKSRADFLATLEEMFFKYKNDKIVLLMHHPIHSNGNYGGNFSFWQHVFPFRNQNVWIPLPVIGSIYPLFRKVGGTKQDIEHDEYQRMVAGIQLAAHKAKVDVIYASGQEKGLQYFDEEVQKFIVSGGGSGTGYLSDGGEADFLHAQRGFVKLYFYEGEEVWAEFKTWDSNTKSFETRFLTQLYEAQKGTKEDKTEYPNVMQGDTIAVANPEFAVGRFQELMLGSNYRDLWNTPVNVPFIDLNELGLKPLKIGGGMSSISLRLQDVNGLQYTLRSVVKVINRQVPVEFRNLKMLYFLQDQNSANFLFGPLIIPTLSKAIGIYYIEPKLVYLKHQPALGNYNKFMPEGLYFLEQRPDGDWSHADQFGRSSKIVSYTDLLDKLQTDNDHFVDQEWVLRSRIFDLWVHDWDRHDDQYRWARFDEGDKKIYRPIPRDRDLAFYSPNGIFPFFISHFMMRKLKPFKKKVSDIRGLAFNSKHYDRFFLNNLDREDWLRIATEVQSGLTDKVLDDALSKVPIEAQDKINSVIRKKLVNRRTDLVDIAMSLYEVLAEEVEIVGHDGTDRITVTVEDNGQVHVVLKYKIKNQKDFVKFDRVFNPKETKEIRIFGLRGKDEISIKGYEKTTIKIKFIGGEDDDELENLNKNKPIVVYDDLGGISLKGLRIQDHTNDRLETNQYDRYGFDYDQYLPFITFGSTPDDGFWFGGGLSWTTYKWRSEPYRSRQSVNFSVAPTSRATVHLSYSGDFPSLFGNIGFQPSFALDFPKYENYFGLGNETNFVSDNISYHWIRMNSISVEPLLKYNTSHLSQLYFGPTFNYNEPLSSMGRVSGDLSLGFTRDQLKNRSYGGLKVGHNLEYVDNSVFPTNGVKLSGNVSYQYEWNNDEHVTMFNLEAINYMRLLARPKLVIANALGFKKAWGDLQFYQHAGLGNNTHLRGLRNSRFRGESLFYHNIDARVQLIQWNNTYLPIDFGLLLGYDYGRVWLSNEDSDRWHSSSTMGIFMDVLGMAIINPHYSITSEEDVFTIRLGFDF